MKSGNFYFLEPSGPLQACNGTALPLPLPMLSQLNFVQIISHTQLLSRILILSSPLLVSLRPSGYRNTISLIVTTPPNSPGEFKSSARCYFYEVLRFVFFSSFALLRWVQILLTVPCFRTFSFFFPLTLGREICFTVM